MNLFDFSGDADDKWSFNDVAFVANENVYPTDDIDIEWELCTMKLNTTSTVLEQKLWMEAPSGNIFIEMRVKFCGFTISSSAFDDDDCRTTATFLIRNHWEMRFKIF